jgi:hypothetical protein
MDFLVVLAALVGHHQLQVVPALGHPAVDEQPLLLGFSQVLRRPG